MSKRKEKLSAFLDSDLHQDELMSFSLSAEPEDADVVQRYQMVGDALRGEMSEASFVDVSHAVREALANENIVDSMTADVEPKAADNTTASSSSKFDWSAWFRPVAGMAVAASVVVVMITNFSEQGSVTPLAENANQQSAEQPVQVAVERHVDEQRIGDKESMTNKNMDPYISQHLEFATQDALQGRLPYVRAVSFEPNKNVEPAQINK